MHAYLAAMAARIVLRCRLAKEALEAMKATHAVHSAAAVLHPAPSAHAGQQLHAALRKLRAAQRQKAQLKEMLFKAQEEVKQNRKELRLQKQHQQLTMGNQEQLVTGVEQGGHQIEQRTKQLETSRAAVVAAEDAVLKQSLVIRQLLVEADRLVNRCVNPGWTHNYPEPMLGPPAWVTAWYDKADGRTLALALGEVEWEDLIVIFRTTADSLRGKGNKAAHSFTVHDQAAAVRAMAGTVYGASLKRIFKFVHGRSPYSP